MRELALNILDIAENSVRAKAATVSIDVAASASKNLLAVDIRDDGSGMSPETAARASDPFTTTRTTRKVGMGLPLLKMDAELCGGSFRLDSEPGAGTTVSTTYRLDHIDRPPMGDLASTMTVLIGGSPQIRWILRYRVDDRGFCFDTEELRAVMDGVPLDEPEVLAAIRDLLFTNIKESNGGITI